MKLIPNKLRIVDTAPEIRARAQARVLIDPDDESDIICPRGGAQAGHHGKTDRTKGDETPRPARIGS
jgi:hypothetical protein